MSTEARHTLFAAERGASARKAWLAGGLTAKGRLAIDAGAVKALHGGASLLAAGVTAASGAFARGDILVGPDNGLLLLAARRLGGVTEARTIENRDWLLPVTSSTFHGRDIMAPVAAHLSLGVDPDLLGPPVVALTALGLRPLVDLDLRLGEGTGALLALPVVQSAARALREVATFDAAGVTDKN